MVLDQQDIVVRNKMLEGEVKELEDWIRVLPRGYRAHWALREIMLSFCLFAGCSRNLALWARCTELIESS